jgi:putative AdoMet-dependent methyltransferase
MKKVSRSQLFDNWAKGYDNSIISGQDGFPFAGYDQILDQVVSIANIRPNMRVLDIGVGTGNLAVRFLDKGCDVSGLDFSVEMLAQTQIKMPRAHLIQADLLGDWTEQIRPPYERVVSAYVFHEFELETKIRLLKQIFSDCLSENGFVVIADIAFPSVDLRAAASQHWQLWDDDEYYWAADEAIVEFSQAGIDSEYKQISSCGGIFTFTKQKAG